MAMGFTTKGLSDLRPLFQSSSSRNYQDDYSGGSLGYGELACTQSALEALEKPGRFNFDFAWDDPCLSDRVLVLQITDEPLHEIPDGYEAWDESADNLDMEVKKLAINDSSPSVDSESVLVQADDERNDPLLHGGEGGHAVLSPSPAKPRTISLNVASLVLAEKSPFFRSMWQKGGMKESLSKGPTILNITEHEEAPVIELLKLIYTGQAKPFSTQPKEIVNLLKAADKFLVSSCIRICVGALKHFPYTLELSLLYLGLPDSLQQKMELKPLIVGAKNYITDEFKDLEVARHQEEFLNLPLHVIEMLLQGDGLATATEDIVFEATLAWVRYNYDSVEERERAVIALAEHIRFPFLSGDYLLDVVAGIPEMGGEAGQSYILEALKFKAHAPERRHRIVMAMKGHKRFLKRPGTELITSFYWDVHSHGIEVASKHCTVQGVLCESQRFCVSGKWFKLQFRKTKVGDTCGLYLSMDHSLLSALKGSVEVDYKFYVKRWPAGEYIVLHPSSKVTFSDGDTTAWGYEEQWQPFSGCPHVNADGYMSIRADLFLKRVSNN